MVRVHVAANRSNDARHTTDIAPWWKFLLERSIQVELAFQPGHRFVRGLYHGFTYSIAYSFHNLLWLHMHL